MDLRAIDPLAGDFFEDPYPVFRALRREAPVHFVESRKIWVLSRFDDVNAAARNPAVFSSTGGVGYDWNQRPMMPMYDPPEHTRMRRMVAKHFTPAALNAFKSRIDELAIETVERALEKGEVDFVQDVAIPVSLGAIAELLGVAPHHRATLRRWSQGTIDDLAGGLSGPPARRVDELRREFNVFLRSLIEERRATYRERAAAIDVITALVAAGEDERLTPRELIAFCVLLLVAGYETTVNAMSNGVRALLDHPEQLSLLRRDPSLLKSAIEEIVRYDGPVLSFFRNTLTDVTIEGVTIPSGAKVMLAFASANRDERRFDDADTFRIDRPATDHVAYGAGVHYCLGAPLARLQLTAIFRELLGRVETIEPSGDAPRSGNVLFRGFRALPLRLAAASASRAAAPQGKPPAAAPPRFEPQPFRLEVPDAMLGELRDRLARARLPDEVEWPGWDYGTPLAALTSLTAYWQDGYDWRKHEAALNQQPHFKVAIDDLNVHYIHYRASSGRGFPLLVLHGWPGPFTLFSRLADRLRKADAGEPEFDLVVASLPGFPLSSASRRRGMSTYAIADVMAKLMEGLGYSRYGIVGEDLGAGTASRMALAYPDRITGIHLNMPHENPPRGEMAQLTPEERAWLKEMARVHQTELTHLTTHAARPQTLGYGLADSPTGLLAWLLEKYYAWSESRGSVENVFSKDELLTNAMLYWITNSIASSIRIYKEMKQMPWFLADGERIATDTAIFLTKQEFVRPPRRWIERVYNLVSLTHTERGGHFAAWEVPDDVAADIRAFFGPRRA